jgi:hypothetical protein
MKIRFSSVCWGSGGTRLQYMERAKSVVGRTLAVEREAAGLAGCAANLFFF